MVKSALFRGNRGRMLQDPSLLTDRITWKEFQSYEVETNNGGAIFVRVFNYYFKFILVRLVIIHNFHG